MLKQLLLFLTVCLLFLQSSLLSGQERTKAQIIDSLEKFALNRPDDTLRADAYEGLSWELKNTGKYDKAIAYGKKGKNLARKLNDQRRVASLCNNLGVVYYRKGNFDSSIYYHNSALEIRKRMNDSSNIGMSYNNLGLVYNDKGSYPLALKYFLASLSIKEKTKDKKGAASALGNIGIAYSALEQPDTSLKYFERSLILSTEIEDHRGIAYTNNNIGVIWFKKKEYEKALVYFRGALESKVKIDDQRGIGGAHANIGAVYDAQGLYQQALDEFNNSLSTLDKMKDNEGITSISNLKGATLLKMKNYDEALKCFQRSYDLASSFGNLPEVKEANKGLALVYEAKGNFGSAYKYFKQYTELKDSLSNEETTRKAVTAQLSYDFDKKEAENKIKTEAQAAIFATEKKRQQFVIYSVVGLLLLAIVFAIFMVNRFRVTNRQKRIIQIKEHQTQKQNEIITVQKHLVEEKHKEITDSINYAERIQRALLASKQLLDENLNDYFILFKPKDVVSGDFYWAAKLNNGNFVLVTADSTGHGVPGAIMSILNIACIDKAVTKMISSPDLLLNETRKLVIENLKNDGSAEGGKDGMDGSLLSFDFKNNVLYSASANNPVWIIRGDELIELKPDRMPIGKHENDKTPFTLQTFSLQKDDLVYTLTDGFADQFGGADGKKFKYKQLQKLVLSVTHEPMEIQKQKLNDAFETWKKNLEQVDDVCLIGVRI